MCLGVDASAGKGIDTAADPLEQIFCRIESVLRCSPTQKIVGCKKGKHF